LISEFLWELLLANMLTQHGTVYNFAEKGQP